MIVKEVLPNGLTVVLKQTKGFGIVSGVLFFRGGILDEKVAGSTRLATYLTIKGSERFSKDEIAETFEDYGGGLGTSTADEYSTVEFSTKVEGLRRAFEVLGDMVLRPRFSEEDLEREKRNTITAIRSEKENPFRFAYSELKRLTFGGTPYERDTLGDEESVMGITREVLLKRWGELVKGGRMVLSVVGDFESAKEVLKSIGEFFGAVPSEGFSYPRFEKPIGENALKRVHREGSQSTIICAFNAPAYDSGDYWAGKVFNAVLGDGFTSLLFRELREKRGYAYATTSFYPTKINLPRFFTYVGTSPDKEEGALRDMLEITASMPFGAEDVEVAKRKIVGDWLMDHQTRLRQAWYLGWFETIGLGYELDAVYTDRIREVSFEEVRAIREKYIDSLHHCAVVSPKG